MRSGGDLVVGRLRNERFAMDFSCKLAVPTEAHSASARLRCGTLTFCKMLPHLATRLVAAVHFLVSARVQREDFFVSQLRSCNKKIPAPDALAEEISALHAAAHRQQRWLYWKCCIDTSGMQSIVRRDNTWSEARDYDQAWTGWWGAAADD